MGIPKPHPQKAQHITPHGSSGKLCIFPSKKTKESSYSVLKKEDNAYLPWDTPEKLVHNDIVTLIPQRLEKELAEAKEHRRPPTQTYAPLPKWHDGTPSQWHDGIQGGIKEMS
jgi:hypothetical protein